MKLRPIKLNNQAKFWSQWQQAKGLRGSNLHNATNAFMEKCEGKYYVYQDAQSSHWLEKNLLLNEGSDYNSTTKICHRSVKSQWCTMSHLSRKFSWFFHMMKIKRFLSNLPAQKTLQTTLWRNGDSYQLECSFSIKAKIWKELPYRCRLMIPNLAFINSEKNGFIDNLQPQF